MDLPSGLVRLCRQQGDWHGFRFAAIWVLNEPAALVCVLSWFKAVGCSINPWIYPEVNGLTSIDLLQGDYSKRTEQDG